MTPACRKCHRINPPVAAYCYFDGVSLAGQAEAAAAAPPGTHTFPMPFTFPSGRACHNYNELALACVDDWSAALAVLHKGHLERFLGGVGRVDLAEAAPRQLQRIPATAWFRFRRAVETTPTILAVVADRPLAKSCATLAVKLPPRRAVFTGRAPFLLLRDAV